jgi:prepilin-type N-terminal cleavage/methylation domain-containing protein
MKKTKQIILHHFTLVELLVVITILAILMSLLTPALRKAVRTATLTVCVNNLKQMGVGLALYAEDYAELYPARSKSSTSYEPISRMYVIRNDGAGYNLRESLEPYHGGGEAMKMAYMCPFIDDDFYNYFSKETRKLGNISHLKGFPFTPNSTNNNTQKKQKTYFGSYKLYYNVYSKSTKVENDILTPMVRLGDRWENGKNNNNPKGVVYSNVVASDCVGKVEFIDHYKKASNHPSEFDPNTEFKVTTNWAFWGTPLSGSNFSTDASYLLDDMSVFLEKEVRVLPVYSSEDYEKNWIWGPGYRPIPRQYWFDSPQ